MDLTCRTGETASIVRSPLTCSQKHMAVAATSCVETWGSFFGGLIGFFVVVFWSGVDWGLDLRLLFWAFLIP